MPPNNVNKNPVWAYFGTENFSVIVLDELKARGFVPNLIVTIEDKPKGRKLLLTPPEIKLWANKNGIQFLQPKKLDEKFALQLSTFNFQLFIVASYGKILPQTVLDIPKLGTLNVHPSLLPCLRGPSPIESAILRENETGVTIIKLDAQMDHGPILAQEKIFIPDWPPYASDLEKTLASSGGKLLADILPDFLLGKIIEKDQDHSKATLTVKMQKTDGELDFNDNPELNLRKIKAYHVWPGAYFFFIYQNQRIRIVVKSAHLEKGDLVLDRIVPEGKNEMDYKDFVKTK